MSFVNESSMKVILVCRMSSSRLPGKILCPFGQTSLLGQVLNRIKLGGLNAEDVIVCTSELPVDEDLIREALSCGCKVFAGDPLNVSARVIQAAQMYGVKRFILVLGDNPWIDPEQIRELTSTGGEASFPYVVTSTPELESRAVDLYYPIGTRLQLIEYDFMKLMYSRYRSEETEEHLSLLFKNCTEGERKIISPRYGYHLNQICDVNISINTRTDYELGLRVIQQVGCDASVHRVLEAYQSLGQVQ